MMGLTTDHLDHLLDFQGYGNLEDSVWFLGIEEKCEKKDIQRNIEQRSRFKPVMDLADAMKLLDENYDVNTLKKSRTPTWTWMAKIMGWLGYADSSSTPIEYIRTRLGRKEQRTFLTDLFPLPAPSIKDEDWPVEYRLLYPTRKTYENAVLVKRQETLRQLIKNHNPRYIFAYGRACQQHYKSLVPASTWDEIRVEGNPLKKRSIFEVSMWDKTTMVITPFFGSRSGLRTADIQQVIEHLKAQEL